MSMKIYQVGGSVRDELLGVKPNDRDWVVVNSSPEEMERQGFKPIGKDFPVFLHPTTKEEYALARTEKKSGVGYKGFKFYFDSSVTLEEDLVRRDFTINSIAKDKSGKIIDPYNGLSDLKNKIFRHTSSAFEEDPLRVLRFARFKTYPQLQFFNPHENTIKCFKKVAVSNELEALSPERVWIETKRALENQYTDQFFKAIIDYNFHNPWFDGLKNVSCSGNSPEAKWADMQRINQFKLCESLPTPNIFQKYTVLLQGTMGLIKCKDGETKVQLIEKLNVHRHYKELESLMELECLDNHKKDLKQIFAAVMSIDFLPLSTLKGDEVSQKKQILYHEALKKIL